MTSTADQTGSGPERLEDTRPRRAQVDGAQIHGGDPALLRRINAVSVLRLLYDRAPLPLSGIMRATGLSRRTIEGVLSDLVTAGLVEKDARVLPRGGVGRPPRGYGFHRRAGCCLAVVVAPAAVTAVVTDLVGEQLVEVRDEVAPEAGRDERLGAIIDCARRALRTGRLRRRELWSVAVGTPGVVRRGGLVSTCTTIPDWSDVDIAGPVGRWARVPVAVENDVNAAARAEQWHGVARDADTMLWVLVLNGARAKASLILDRTLYRGWTGAAGEIGLLSGLSWSPGAERRVAPLRSDDPVITRAERKAHELALPLAALVLILNPPLLVLGGAPGDAVPGLGPAVTRQLQALCHTVPRVEESALGADSAMLGTIRTALDEVERRLFALT